MKKQTRFMGLLAIAALVALPTITCAQQTNKLDAMKATYDGLTASIDADCQKQKKAALATYGQSLEASMSALKKKGDLDGFLAVQKEKERFAKETTILDPAAEGLHPLVAKAIVAHAKAMQQFDADKATRVAALTQKYVSALDGLIKELMAKDKIEDAKTARAEKERVMALATVSAPSNQPSATVSTVNSNEPPATPTAPVKTVSATKARGVVGGWKKTFNGVNYNDLHEFLPDGTVEVSGAKNWSGKYSFANSSKTKIRWRTNMGTTILLKYDPTDDVLVQDDGGVFHRVPSDQ